MLPSIILRPLQKAKIGNRGSSLIEFAITAPLLIFLAFGGAEITLYLILDQKLRYLANRVADLTARETLINDSQLEAIYALGPNLMRPFQFRDDRPDGKIIISIIRKRNPGDRDPVIIKQGQGGGTLAVTSQIGQVNEVPILPASFVMESWETVIVGEAFYDYKPWFLTDIIPVSRRMYHRSFYRPRVPATFNVSDLMDLAPTQQFATDSRRPPTQYAQAYPAP